MVECYSGLYEESEVEHINGVWPSFLPIEFVCSIYGMSLHPVGGESGSIKSATSCSHLGLLITPEERLP